MRETLKEKGIISLVVIMSVGLFALGSVLAVSTGILGELIKNKNTVSGDQAFYTAEAGMKEGTYQYLNSLSYSGGTAVLLNNAAGGDIVVATSTWPYIIAKGTAENIRSYRGVLHTITVFPEGFAFDHAVYAHNDLTLGGSVEVNGSVFANDGIDFHGANAAVNGNAYSPGDIEDHGNISGLIVPGVDPIPLPHFDLEPYRQAAIVDGTLFSSSTEAETYLNNQTRNAVIFVDDVDKTKIQGTNTNLTGSLVTMGNLDLTGGTFTASDNYLAIVVNGDLKIAGGATINGIVYVTGDTSFGGGNNVITGALICGGETIVTDITGNATINYDAALAQSWHDLVGLDTVSSEVPQVILWEEE
jgi:hypothetical protein